MKYVNFLACVCVVLGILIQANQLFAQNHTLNFDGLHDYVQVPNSADFDFSGNFTMEVKFKRQVMNQREDLIGKKNLVASSPSKQDLALFIETNNRITGYISNTSSMQFISSTTLADTSEWMHVALVRSGSIVSLYVDGVQEATVSNSGTCSSNGPFRIGANRKDSAFSATASPTHNFNGQIDEVRVWNIARTGSQIFQKMNTELTGTEPGLKVYFNFNQGEACGSNLAEDTLYDVTGNLNHGALIAFDLTGTLTDPCQSNWQGDFCHAVHTSIAVNECVQYISPGGHVYTSSGIYYDTLTSANNCDSIVTINLNIGKPNTSVLQNGTSLVSLSIVPAYQWLDCNNGNIPLPGATKRSFIATLNGSYRVVVINGNCSDTSDCYTVSTVGINDIAETTQLMLYPNPSKGILNLTVNGKPAKGEVIVFNAIGSVVHRVNLQGDQVIVLPADLNSGVYVLQLKNAEQFISRRFILTQE